MEPDTYNISPGSPPYCVPIIQDPARGNQRCYNVLVQRNLVILPARGYGINAYIWAEKEYVDPSDPTKGCKDKITLLAPGGQYGHSFSKNNVITRNGEGIAFWCWGIIVEENNISVGGPAWSSLHVSWVINVSYYDSITVRNNTLGMFGAGCRPLWDVNTDPPDPNNPCNNPSYTIFGRFTNMIVFKNASSINVSPSSEGQIKFLISKIQFPIMPQGAIGNLTGGYKWYKIIYSGNQAMVSDEGANWGIWLAFQNYHESDAPSGVYKANLLVW